jgi:NodT family efflux transporter outer membrane factor (OMF) lipoprotein
MSTHKTKTLRLLAGGALAALLAACATVGPDFKTPQTPKASGYAMAGDAPAPEARVGETLQGDWWSLFRSPEIDAVVRQAIAGNHSLEAARASLAQARDAVQAQESRLQLEGQASAAEQRVNLASFGFAQLPGPDGPIKLSNPTFTIYSFGLTGRYDFDLFGQRRRQTETLLAKAEAQGFQTDAALLTLTAQVVSQAIDIASLKAQIAAAGDIVKSDQDNLDLVTKAYQLGGGTKLDVSTVQTELASDQSQITPLRQRLAAARHALALLVGQAPAGWSPPEFDLDRIALPSPAPVELPSELVRSRPDIRAAEARLHAATAEIGVAEADLYPKLTLTGAISQSALHPQDLFSYAATGFNLGPGITLPILNRPQLKAHTRMAEDAARAALADYEQTVLQAFVQVADSLQAIAHDDESIAEVDRALASSTESLRLQRLRFRDGKTGLLPVLDAQRSYARARLASVRAKAQRLQDTAALLYAVSRNWESSGRPPPQEVAAK